MAKDPAFLFYYQDFLVGTAFMTKEECGDYIRLLCYQASRGHLNLDEILKITTDIIWKGIRDKFKTDVDGLYYNQRLEDEIAKRSSFTESRRKNLHMAKHMGNHMGVHMGSHMKRTKSTKMSRHMENENENENKDKKEKVLFKEYVYLTTEEHEKLKVKIGRYQTEDYIDRVNHYIGSKGKKYSSHYHTILSWWLKDGKPVDKKDREEKASSELLHKYGAGSSPEGQKKVKDILNLAMPKG